MAVLLPKSGAFLFECHGIPARTLVISLPCLSSHRQRLSFGGGLDFPASEGARMLKGRSFAIIGLAVAMAVSGTALLGKDKKKKVQTPASKMDDRQQVIHALNRFTFGPRPGEVDRVMAMGLDKWIDQQLNPDKISDSLLDARLAQYRTLRMNNKELVENFPPPQVLKAVADGRMGMPHDAERRAVYEAGVARYQQRKDKKEAQADAPQPMQDDQSQLSDEERARRRELRMQAVQKADSLSQLSPDQRVKQILAMD